MVPVMSLAALTLPLVAERLACSVKTVRRLIATNQLRAYQVSTAWRVEPDDLEAFVEERRAAANRAVTRSSRTRYPEQGAFVVPRSKRK